MSLINPHLSSGKNIRLFKRDWMEKFTYVHPLFPITFWGTVVALSFAKPMSAGQLSWQTALITTLGGTLFWSLAEYILHRWIFHFKPHGRLQEQIAFLIHGIHHEDPNDARRLLMPPVAAILLSIPFYALFISLLGDALGHVFFAGFLFGYLIYDYTHFAVHFARFKSARFKTLKHNHMQHHFVSQEARFGVSTMFWDRVFGTHVAATSPKQKPFVDQNHPPQPSC